MINKEINIIKQHLNDINMKLSGVKTTTNKKQQLIKQEIIKMIDFLQINILLVKILKMIYIIILIKE